MRFPLVLFLLANAFSLFAQTNAGFTLDELLLKRYDSKKKYPATVLRNEPDAFPDLIPVKIYQGKALYTGKIIDEKGSLKIEATVNDGNIIDFNSWDSEATRKQAFHVSTGGMYAWYATDSVFYDNQLFSSGMYYQDPDGNVMMLTRMYEHDNNVLEYSYRIGTKYADEVEFDEPLQDGLVRSYHNGNLSYFETWHDGYIDGEVIQYDENQTVLQRYYVNAVTGLYGTYYEYDTVQKIVTIGHYTDLGVETGQWISKYADSSIAAIHWISEAGNPDSSKVWDRKGKLQQVNYNYWRSSKTVGVNDYIHYSKTWHGNGQTNLYTNYNPGKSDTIQAWYDVTGVLLSVERNMNGRLQSKAWHTNGQPKSERYGVSTGIAGVTLRDSVYREWSANGNLEKERYYAKGKYLRNEDPRDAGLIVRPNPRWHGPANWVANTTPVQIRNWDTSSVVPESVIDSIELNIDNVSWFSREQKPECEVYLNKVHETQTTSSPVRPEFNYRLTLSGLEKLKLDSTGKIITNNFALNAFLDSFNIRGAGVTPIGNYVRKKGKVYSDFSVVALDVPGHLNLFFLNRRLSEIAPGSEMNCYAKSTATLPAEIIYIPQGEKTPTGPSPITVVAVANEGSTRELKVGSKTIQWDARPFYVFYVYGDGEVEFARTTYKDTILLQYRGERTGVYDIQR